jgi:hypothetical protein
VSISHANLNWSGEEASAENARPRLAFTGESFGAGEVGTLSLNLLQRLCGHGLLMPSMKKAAP